MIHIHTLNTIQRLHEMISNKSIRCRELGNELKAAFHILRLEANEIGTVTSFNTLTVRAGNTGYINVIEPDVKIQPADYQGMKFVHFNGRIIGVIAIQAHREFNFFRRNNVFVRTAIFAVSDNLEKEEQEVLHDEHDKLLNVQDGNWLRANAGVVVKLPAIVTAPQQFF